MLANELIDLLESRGILSQKVIFALRKRVSENGAGVTVEKVANTLVSKQLLTREMAGQLVQEVRQEAAKMQEQTGAAADLKNDLEIVEEVQEAIEKYVEVVPVHDADNSMVNKASADSDFEEGRLSADGSQPTRQKTAQKESVWDSFKIYGVAGFIIAFVLLGIALWVLLSKGDATKHITRADELYNVQNYVAATEAYANFLKTLGEDNEHSSIARVRIGMSSIFESVRGNADPIKTQSNIQQVLPTIENETGMDKERANLAGILVSVAEQIVGQAERVEGVDEKQYLLNALDEQTAYFQDAKYISADLRKTLATRIQIIDESRARVQRSINRDRRLSQSIIAIREALDAEDTEAAYHLRSKVLHEYPELQSNSQLDELVLEASQIQMLQTEPAKKIPKTVLRDDAVATVRSVVLANQSGRANAKMRGRVVYFRASGSVIAFTADQGNLLWRLYVGFQDDHAPVTIGDEVGEGVLLSDGQKSEILRVAGPKGAVQWRCKINEDFSEPMIFDGAVYTTAKGGRVISLDKETGDARWVTKIPQELEISPGFHQRTSRVYQPGSRSNLYVLDHRNGKCLQSYFLGHRLGTIRVPPIALLGHLFVIENAGSDFALIHVLKMDENGSLEQAQDPFRLVGNVTTSPTIQKRRLIVLTDRGQVQVFDVEPTAKEHKVSKIAERVPTHDQPMPSMMEVGRSEIWVAGSRLERYEIQVNNGRIVSDWGKYEGDLFVASPRLIDDTLFHARVLKGTDGVHVSAVDAKTGNSIWQTDVGVPITMLAPIADNSSVYAITSQAALYRLDRRTIRQGTTTLPLENPGAKGVLSRFAATVKVDEVSSVLLNLASSRQIAVFDPRRTRQKLRLVTLALPPGRATALPIFTGGGLLVPLDSGRVMLMNHQTGASLGTPFHPAASPEENVDWYQMVTVPEDPDQAILGDDRGKLFRIRTGKRVRKLADVDLEDKFLGPMAAQGNRLMATVAGPIEDRMVLLDVLSLDEKEQLPLPGRVLWGPVVFGDHFLFRTDDGQLHGFDSEGQRQWSVDLPGGDLVGHLELSGQKVLLTGRPGWLVVLDPESGQIYRKVDLGQPLSGSPILIQDNLLVPGSEGTIIITPVPSQTAANTSP